jgi:hypothetical protein
MGSEYGAYKLMMIDCKDNGLNKMSTMGSKYGAYKLRRWHKHYRLNMVSTMGSVYGAL